MDCKEIEAYFLWLPIDHENLNTDHIKSALKNHIELDFKYKESDKKKEALYPYNELTYKFDLAFDIKDFKNVSEFYKLIITKWCEPITRSPQACLFIPLIEPTSNPYELSRRKLTLKAFRLGSFFGLNKFYSHFSSEKITEEELPNFNPNHLNPKKNYSSKKKCSIAKKNALYFDIENENILIRFFYIETAGANKIATKYYVDIKFSQIKSITVETRKNKKSNTKEITLYFQLENSLILYQGKQTNELKKYIYDNKVKKRVTEISNNVFTADTQNTEKKKAFCSESIVGNSRCLQIVLEVPENCDDIDNFLIRSRKNYYFAHVDIIEVKPDQQTILKLPKQSNFDSYYALHALMKRGFDINDQFMNKSKEDNIFVNEMLQKFSEKNPKALSYALFNIFTALDNGNIVVFENAVKSLFTAFHKKMIDNFQDFDDVVLVKRAIITPSKVIFLPPNPFLINKVFRDIDPEFALRVHVRDDDNNLLSHSLYTKLDEKELLLEVEEDTDTDSDEYTEYVSREEEERRVYNFKMKFFSEKIQRKLQHLTIGPRKYDFVGCSSSQLKDNGVLMYARNGDINAQTIRESIGNLDQIEIISKYIARMGQGFSQSMGWIKVEKHYVKVEEDIKDGYYDRLKKDKRFTFSDGIGKISKDLIEEIYKAMKLEIERPSAFQIRYGGCKGMLVYDPDLTGKQIIFRKSMEKFESPSEQLDIVGFSNPAHVYLNKALITILEQKGISSEVFLKLQFDTLSEYYKAFVDEDIACLLLKSTCGLHLPFDTMRNNGISFTSEPFFRALLEAIIKQRIQTLKSKAKIKISPDYGRNMYGVLDEKVTLKYGEVFFQYSNDVTNPSDEGPCTVYEGEVIVTKNPCNRLGDVRKLKAVRKKNLMHIKNCIVFPSQGNRPHPNEMAGSDLDGDEYVVIWHPDLIFTEENHEPSDFPPSEEKNINRTVEVSDMISFFGEYILNDNIGLIANAHLAYADKYGLNSRYCQRLAELYSISLDFAKTGESAKMDIPKPKNWPDFMDKNIYFYVSTNVLGHLFRNCRRIENCMKSVVCDFQLEPNPDFIHKDWRDYETEALQALKDYQLRIKQILQHYNVKTEGELMSGAIINYNRTFYAKDEDYDLHRIISKHMNSVFKNYHNMLDRLDNLEEKLKFTSAIYMVTATKNPEPFFGLPWTLYEKLILLKKRNQQSLESGELPLHKKLDKLFRKPCTLQQMKETYQNITKDWLKKNSDFFKSLGIRRKHVEETVNRACKLIVDNANPKIKGFSPGANLIKVFEKIISLCLSSVDDSKIKFRKSLALLAIITLTRLTMSNDQTILASDSPMLSSNYESWEIVKVYLKDDYLKTVAKNEEEVKAFLIKCIPLSEIIIDYNVESYTRRPKKLHFSNGKRKTENGWNQKRENGKDENGWHHNQRRQSGKNAHRLNGKTKNGSDEEQPEFTESCLCFFKILGNAFYRECFKDLVGQHWFLKSLIDRELPNV